MKFFWTFLFLSDIKIFINRRDLQYNSITGNTAKYCIYANFLNVFTFDKGSRNIGCVSRIASRGMKICLGFRRKCNIILERRCLAKVHKFSWDHKAGKQALLRAFIYVRNTFAAVFLVVSARWKRTTRFPRARRITGNTRETFPFGRLVSNLEVYIPCRVFMQTRFPRKSRLISHVSPSGDSAVGRHIYILVALVNVSHYVFVSYWNVKKNVKTCTPWCNRK